MTDQNEWIKVEKNIATIGITKFVKDQLGEIVYVELPKVGSIIKAQEEIALLESNKSAVDIYSPVSGKVVEVNSKLLEDLSLINDYPESKGWLFKVEVKN